MSNQLEKSGLAKYFEVKDLMCQDFCIYCMSEIINKQDLMAATG